jgi:hypothetical protein
MANPALTDPSWMTKARPPAPLRESGMGVTPSETMVRTWCHSPRSTSGWVQSQLKWPCRDSATMASTGNGTSAGEARWMRGAAAAGDDAKASGSEESNTRCTCRMEVHRF